MRYPVAIEPGTETEAFGVVVPDLPGCFSAGDTMEEAMAEAEEAIAAWIETALDTGYWVLGRMFLSRPASRPCARSTRNGRRGSGPLSRWTPRCLMTPLNE